MNLRSVLGFAAFPALSFAAGGRPAAPPLSPWAAQLVLNAAWSRIFFGLQRPGEAVAEILLLWVAVLATLLAFLPIHRGAALPMVPYLAWGSFAAILNGARWRLNH